MSGINKVTAMLTRWFLAHPRSAGESYFEHQRMAFAFSLRLFAAGTACFIHALVPGLFEFTGSRTVALLHAQMVANRSKAHANQAQTLRVRAEPRSSRR